MKAIAKYVKLVLEQSTGVIVKKKTIEVTDAGVVEVIIGGLSLHPHLFIRFHNALKEHQYFISIERVNITDSMWGDILIKYDRNLLIKSVNDL